MTAFFWIFGLLIAVVGVLETARISVGVSIAIIGAAIMVSAAVDGASRAIIVALKPPKD